MSLWSDEEWHSQIKPMLQQTRADDIEKLTIRVARLRARLRDLRAAFGPGALNLTDVKEMLAEAEDQLRCLKGEA